VGQGQSFQSSQGVIVTPAKAGVQVCVSRDPKPWIPAISVSEMLAKKGSEITPAEPTSLWVEGIILAAGLSTRMTYCKLEAEIEGVPLVMRVVRAAAESELSRVVLVTGAEGVNCLGSPGAGSTSSKVQMVANLNPERGMASSMCTGLDAVSSQAAGAMVLLGDQPGITAEIINELLGEFRRNPGKMVVPFIFGRKTTPVIFPADLFPELKAIVGDVGGRDVLGRNAERLLGVELGTRYNDTDVDTPEDLEKIRKQFQSVMPE
jgi:molybdenum cofactor cytidylyltransferase